MDLLSLLLYSDVMPLICKTERGARQHGPDLKPTVEKTLIDFGRLGIQP